MAFGWTKPLTEMSARGFSWGKGGPLLRDDNLTTYSVYINQQDAQNSCD